MANTLNLGNGDWATKENSLLGYNSESGNYKPLAFDFTRASNGTFVNKSGLIETAANGVPRIDFLGNTKGALKLEPQRTNLIIYSEDFTSSWFWTKDGSSVTSGFTSPDGTDNAFKLIENSSNSKHRIYSPNLVVSNGATLTTSIFVKSAERSWFLLQESTTDYGYYFNNGQVGSSTGSPLSYKIDELANGWYKYSITTVTTSTTGRFKLNVVKEDGGSTEYQGDGTSGLYIYGAQLEQGSYSTSLINTQGSAVTRLADSCSQTVPSGVIGQTEGTIYTEYYFDATIDNAGGGDRDIVNINDGTFNNIIQLIHYGNGIGSAYKRVYLNARLSSSYVVSIGSSAYGSGLMKVAGAYKNNDYVLYVNGVQMGTDTNAGVPSCSVINFAKITGIQTPTPINETKLYNTRLSNAELAALTTL